MITISQHFYGLESSSHSWRCLSHSCIDSRWEDLFLHIEAQPAGVRILTGPKEILRYRRYRTYSPKMAQGRPQPWLELFHITNGELIQFSKLLCHWRLAIGLSSRYLASHLCGEMCKPWRCAAQIPFQENLLQRWYLEDIFQMLQIQVSSRAPTEAMFSMV